MVMNCPSSGQQQPNSTHNSQTTNQQQQQQQRQQNQSEQQIDFLYNQLLLPNSLTTKDDTVKTKFCARGEGTYLLVNPGEYYRPNRAVIAPTPQNLPVKCSFISLPDSPHKGDKICFNIGREIFVHNFRGSKKPLDDLNKEVDRKCYKGTYPTCHDFNQANIYSGSLYLLVGFSYGQIQLMDPIKKEMFKLYNEERLIEKTKVTCIKWLPGSCDLFIVSHLSGQLYVYKQDLPCGTQPPHYQMFKQGDGYAIYTCKTKSTRNPLYRWVIGDGAINEFAFSPCGKYLAVVSQDGFLRVFNYDSMSMIGKVRSYFGGFLCACWSPDSKYVVTGGEDDLVTVWSVSEKRVVARGQGHKSWVSVVAFDPYVINNRDTVSTTSTSSSSYCNGATGSDDCDHESVHKLNGDSLSRVNSSSKSPSPIVGPPLVGQQYRFGSVGQDTQLCLWNLSEDLLKQRCTTVVTPVAAPPATVSTSTTSSTSSSGSTSSSTSSNYSSSQIVGNHCNGNDRKNDLSDSRSTISGGSSIGSGGIVCIVSGTETLSKKEHRRNFSLGSRYSDKSNYNKASHSKTCDDPLKLLGTAVCPRLDEVAMLEPFLCKKIGNERLTSLTFRKDCFVTACQEGNISTWARPGRHVMGSPSPSPSYVADVNDIDESGSTIV